MEYWNLGQIDSLVSNVSTVSGAVTVAKVTKKLETKPCNAPICSLITKIYVYGLPNEWIRIEREVAVLRELLTRAGSFELSAIDNHNATESLTWNQIFKVRDLLWPQLKEDGEINYPLDVDPHVSYYSSFVNNAVLKQNA